MLKCICIYSHVSDRNRGLASDFVRLKKGFIPWKIRKSSKMPISSKNLKKKFSLLYSSKILLKKNKICVKLGRLKNKTVTAGQTGPTGRESL